MWGLGVMLLITLAMSTAEDLPSVQVNPVSGSLEIVDEEWSGTHFNIRHVEDPGGGAPLQVSLLSASSDDDRGGRLAILSHGESWATWWRDGTIPRVVYRRRVTSTGSWQSEEVISDPLVPSRNPSIAVDGSYVWIAWEAEVGTSRQILVRRGDGGVPWPDSHLIGSTSFTGALDSMLHTSGGELWVSWVDTNQRVGWSVFDRASSTWTAPLHESYALDSVQAARARIESQVTGQGS